MEKAVQNGIVISDYPEDKPYPSRLILYKTLVHIIHVVAADDINAKVTYIITVYVPDVSFWNEDFTERRTT